MKNKLTLLLMLCSITFGWANLPAEFTRSFDWSDQPMEQKSNEVVEFLIYHFDGAVFSESHPSLPYYSERFEVSGPGSFAVEIADVTYENFNKEVSDDDAQLSSTIQITTKIEKSRDRYFARVAFIPIIKNGNSFQRATSITLRTRFQATNRPIGNNREGETYVSALSDGDIYKFSITETGMYKLSYDFLKNDLGIDIDNVNPANIQLLGNGGGVLPEDLEAPYIDDLAENPIRIIGGADGSFDSGDFILFYGEGPTVLTYNEDQNIPDLPMNFYDDENFYFIKIGNTPGKRIQSKSSTSGATYTVDAFDAIRRYEDDRVNLMHDWSSGQGSGQDFFGDFYKIQTEYDYSDEIALTNPVSGSNGLLSVRMAARVLNGSGSARMEVEANGSTFTTTSFGTTSGSNETTYAHVKSIREIIPISNNPLTATVRFINNGNTNHEAWLDYIQINYRQTLAMIGEQMNFRDVNSRLYEVTQFNITADNDNFEIWDVTNPIDPFVQNYTFSNGQITFGGNTLDEIREYVIFNPDADLLTNATAIGQIENQNIHAIDNIDFVIIYHNDFKEQAERLANHRADHSNMEVALVDVDLLKNEFSSGRTDATGIRNFARMLYDRSEQFKYLLLFGDGSYDFRGIYNQGNDFVTVYETKQSLSPISAYPTDDYFTILDEGETLNSASLDIAVGRLPVKNTTEADILVDKIIAYDTDDDFQDDWRNRVLFVADDEDGNTHINDADGIADDINAKNPNLNIEKVYVDAYPQVSTPAGTRVPLATAALNQNIFKGVLAVTYLGHGGSRGWTQERILKLEDIFGWENEDRLPLFITATCSFAGYDDPGFTTGGEEMLLKEGGGAIALFSTTRAVFASANEQLTRASVDTLFFKINNQIPTIGEVLRISKNKPNISDSNSRKFVLLGDPSMQLALPEYNVETLTINGENVSTVIDTISALEQVTITGQVTDDAGNLISDFNGIVIPTVYDKRVTNQTLGQDPGSPVKNYTLQNSVVFKGNASVVNGQFSFTFVVPQDIDYNFGNGKISYYAYDNSQMKDAAGNFNDFIIGGTSENGIQDDQGPMVEVFMNTESFVYGSMTDNNPTLLIKLQDDNGINVTGTSIGHDLTAILNQNTANTLILNDFYEAELDDYTRGTVRYPLEDLEVGEYEVVVSAWDVANNNTEGHTKFIVVESEDVALENVLNYPNPFTTNTCFMFQHNMGGQDLDVLVNIYTVSGRLIKTIEQRVYSEGFQLSRDNCIKWDGRDDFGDPLAKGVYIYKVKVRASGANFSNGDESNPNRRGQMMKGESDFEKLVILK